MLPLDGDGEARRVAVLLLATYKDDGFAAVLAEDKGVVAAELVPIAVP